MKGVIAVVKLANGLAVVADNFETAKAGRAALKVTWRKAKAEGFNSDRALEDYVKIHADANAQAVKLEEKGDAAAAFAAAAKTYHASAAITAITPRWSRSTRWCASTMPATRSRLGRAVKRPT